MLPPLQDIKSWDETLLLNWVQKALSVPLKADDAARFLDARITGNAFLYAAGIFEKAGISIGPSFDLSQLAKTIVDSERPTSKFYLINLINTTQTYL
jgi:hypothetical protein